MAESGSSGLHRSDCLLAKEAVQMCERRMKRRGKKNRGEQLFPNRLGGWTVILLNPGRGR